jgi:acyl-CoA synthetase (AMP-forming)/AMP-acid ligase II
MIQSTWVRLLREKAQRYPDLPVCTFLADGETQEVSDTYAELDARARTIAAVLQSRYSRGDRALLLFPPGLEYIRGFLGCLYAGIVAVPLSPPPLARVSSTLPRLRSVVADLQPDVVLTTTAGLKLATALAPNLPQLGSVQWLASDDLGPEGAGTWRDPCVTSDSVAFIQYTSGSTAAPKGVVLTHGNTLHNSAAIQEALGHTGRSAGVIWLPPYHDMGLVGGILQPLYVGFPVVLLSPLHFLQRPLRWLAAVSRYRATTTAGPDFAFDLCVRRTTPEQRSALDLSCVESAVVGAEPVNPATLERFVEAFSPHGFRREALRPCYGLAESTLMVTASAGPSTIALPAPPGTPGMSFVDTLARPGSRTARVVVSCGQPNLGQRVVVVDPDSGTPCPSDTIGEVWVSGPSVGAGYWDRPEETEAVFGAHLSETEEGWSFLRTGDLGFVHHGDLFITGRLKDLIIIRGRKHHPTDIERTVARSHPALRPGGGAAFAISVDGQEQLVVVHETERHHPQRDRDAMVGAIRSAVIEEHDVLVNSVRLVRPGSLPRTSNGKTQRSACRESFLAGAFDVSHESLSPPSEDGQ